MPTKHDDLGFKPASHEDLGFVPSQEAISDENPILKEVGLTLVSPWLTKSGRDIMQKAGSTLYGLAESTSPAAIPRGLETLARAGHAYATEPGGILASLQKGEERSILPGKFGEYGALIRAGTVGPGEQRPFKARYQEELNLQNETEKKLLDPNYRMTGEIGGIALGLAQIAKTAAGGVKKILGGKETLSKMAGDAAFDSLKPLKSVMETTKNADRTAIIGNRLLKDKIMGPGTSWQKMLTRTESKMDEYGEVIGNFTRIADDAREAGAIRGIKVKDVLETVKNTLVPKLKKSGESDVAETILNWANKNLKGAASQGEIGYEQVKDILGTLRNRAKFNKFNPDPAANGFQELYHVVNERRIAGIESALKAAGAEADMGLFLEARDGYRDLKDAHAILSKTTAGQRSNLKFGLRDMLMLLGGVGTTEDASRGARALTGLAGAVISKGMRERGNQVVAYGLSKIAEQEPTIESLLQGLAGTSTGIRKMSEERK